jgi:hypothetical protein
MLRRYNVKCRSILESSISGSLENGIVVCKNQVIKLVVKPIKKRKT